MDATRVRLSDSFMLSDFLGCTSVYYYGYPNKILRADMKKVYEGEYLCENLLEPIMDEQGPLSICYGYISPDLSRTIVKYQDPNKPSYHRWDHGAAADIIVHDWVQKGVKGHEGDDPESAPIFLAHWLDQNLGYSRMITYSESPCICVATRKDEGDEPRRAFYENRYQGIRGAKPHFITYPKGHRKREQMAEQLLDMAGDLHDWRGHGYPTYHAGGRKGFEHVRMGKYVMLSDLLYSESYVQGGIRNRVPTSKQNVFWKCAKDAANVIDELTTHFDRRISVSRGYEQGGAFDWGAQRCFSMEITLPIGINMKEAAELVGDSEYTDKVLIGDLGMRLTLRGRKNEKVVGRKSSNRRVEGHRRKQA